MSFKTQSLFVKQIENEIEDNKLSLEDILSKVNLSIILNQKLPKLTNFLILHVRDIIEYSFIKDTDEIIKNNAYSILLDFQPVRNIICKDPNLINLIIKSYLDDNKNTISLLNLLRRIVESSNALALHQIDQSSAFFQNLLNNLDKIYVREFLIFLVSHPSLAPFRKWLLDINANDLFYQKLNEDQSNFTQEKVLLILSKYILVVDKISQVLQKLASKSKISYILNLGLNNSKISLSKESFKYIYTLCQSISDSERMKSSMSEIRTLLSENCEKLCNFVQRDHQFHGDKQYAIELIILVVSFKTDAEKYIFNFAHFLFDLFIELKTNTFLHRSFLRFFRVLTAFKLDFARFVNSSKLMNRIVSLVDQKDSLLSSYWGHIYKISSILNKLIEDKQCDLEFDEKWQKYITEVYNVQHEIIKRNYGGQIPKNLNESDDADGDSLFYHSHFVDSIDLLSRNYKQLQSSSDSEEEYEEDSYSNESSPSNSPSASESNSDEGN